MHGHAPNRLLSRGRCAVGLVGIPMPAFKRRRWESNPLQTALQAVAVPSGSSVMFTSSVLARNRTWSTSFAGSRANPAHSEDNCLVSSAPPRSRTSSCSFEDCHASITLAGHQSKYPDLDSNQDHELRRLGCDPLHHRDKFHTRADDWIRTSMNRFTRPAPFSFEPRRQSSTSARSRTPFSGFGGRLLSQEHNRVRPPGCRLDRRDFATAYRVPHSSTPR